MTLLTRYILPVLLITLSAFTAGAQSANFTVDRTADCSPLVVHFTNTTGSCPGCTYDWDFGNGDPHSPSPGPVSSSYSTPGTYTATLTVHNGGITTTHTVTLTVYPSPTVSFIASDTSVCPGMPITFTSTSTGGVPGPMTYTWSFGDGASPSTTSTTISHTYVAPGFYNVTLFATNSEGCQSSLHIDGYVHVFTPATPNFSAPNTYFCNPPGHAVFTNLTGGTGPFSYTWEFGDGTPNSTLATPTHDYTVPGPHDVTLVVTDGNGCTDSVTRTAYIFVANLNAAFSAPDTACVSTNVIFSNTSTPPSVGSTWTFGDGSASLSATTGHHIYTVAGTYPVRLIISDGICRDTIIRNIVILPGPVTSFTITPVHPCPPPTTLTFNATAPSGTGITWFDGDGTGPGSTGTGLTFSHTYTHRGVYTIKMISTNLTTGCVDTITVKDTLYDLVFHVQASPVAGCKPLTVNFTTSALTYEPDTLAPHPYPYGFASYSWNYGDGSSLGAGATPSHTYTAAGVYTAIVTATTNNGCTVQDSIKIFVGQPPIVDFTGTPLHECYHNNFVSFTSTIITGPAYYYTWVFGDGTSQSDSSGTVVHHYILPGVFTVTLTAFYNGCPSTPVVKTNYVTIDSPQSIISAHILCSPHTRVVFGDSSLGDDTHLWMFGDLVTSTADNPVHDYPANSVYTVTLTTYNAASGCRDTSSKVIDLHKPIPTFTADDTAICKDQFIHFTPTVTGGVASEYFWYRNGVMRDDTSAIYLDTFHVAGIYTIMLAIMDQNGCLDSFIKPNYVVVAHPVPTFTASPLSGCSPLAVTFTDHSTDVTGVPLSTFAWTYGDGATGSGTTTTIIHTFTASGAFTTKEVVTDVLGCKDSVTLSLVTAFKPTAALIAANVHPCRGATVNFTNTSSMTGGATLASSYWWFGDGTTSTSTSPTHVYTTIGTYDIRLAVTDSHGCTDTATMVGYIDVNRPAASFYMDDSISICPPLSTHFINTSTGGTSYNWSLGDGSSSTAPSPADLYISAGDYPIRLIVTNMYGCKDTAYGNAVIYGYSGAFSYTPDSGCSPLTVHFTATISNVPSVVWDFADGNTVTVSGTDTVSHVYAIPGAYIPKLILSDNSGCQSSSDGADTIKVDGVTAGFTTAPNPVCLGMTFNFVDTSHSYWSTITSWNWLFNSTTSSISAPSFLVAIPGTYPATLQVTDGWGCTNNATADVNVYPPPIITVSPDTIICVGDAATLTGYGGVSYTWSPDATLSCTSCNPSLASPVDVTTYTVTGTDIHGCTNTDTTTVFLKTKTVSVAYMDTAICQGAIIKLRDSGATKFTWSPAAGLSSTSIATPFAAPQQTTKYTIIAQLASCIPDTNTLIITVYPGPTVDAGPNQTVVAGSEVQLLAKGTNIYSYRWDNANVLSCDSCANPIATMSVTTHFNVTVESPHGCKNSDSVTVYIFCDESQIFIPNAFTPNGDGQNDIFYPRGTGVSIIKSFRIYNRWGELLFERTGIKINDASNAWNGFFNGGPPKPDVYVYVIDALCETGAPLNLKGDVTIIR